MIMSSRKLEKQLLQDQSDPIFTPQPEVRSPEHEEDEEDDQDYVPQNDTEGSDYR